MENSLLEIELVHYVVILMWIPLILQVETTTPAIFKLIIVSFFLLSWLSIELQSYLLKKQDDSHDLLLLNQIDTN